MAAYETFRNAPITEAVLEFQLRLKGEAHWGRLALVQDAIRDRYPHLRETNLLSGGIQLPPGGPIWTTAEKRQVGFMFDSADKKQILHARLNGFGFSRLKPYESWDAFKREASILWDHFKKAVQPERITRIGLRYINRIELPLPIDDFADFILTRPEIPSDLPHAVSAYGLQLVITDASGASANVNQFLEPLAPAGKAVPLIFDIDAYREVDLAPEAPEAWTIVEQLRILKNEVFFKSLTAKTKELFR